jgi:hypothetical protein
MGIRVDLSDVESGGFDPIPAGRYPLRVFDGEIRESGPKAKNPGSEYIAWEFIVESGDFEDRHLWTNTSLLPQALFGLKGLLGATGQWSAEELDAADFDFDIDDVLGSLVMATVTVRNDPEYGESNVIKRFKPIDASELSSTLP